MRTNLARLPAHSRDGALRVVVEAPRGSGIKLKYDPKLGVFEYGRALPAGLTYPYDWGFVPGTRAEDGDPLDALALCDAPSFPGVVIPCRPLGVLLLDQKEGGRRERNDRLVVVPLGADRFEELQAPEQLSKRLRQELEQFFLDTTFFSGKDARCLGWRGPRDAEEQVRRASRRARR
jgi:inorganic pyrophosphatase